MLQFMADTLTHHFLSDDIACNSVFDVNISLENKNRTNERTNDRTKNVENFSMFTKFIRIRSGYGIERVVEMRFVYAAHNSQAKITVDV